MGLPMFDAAVRTSQTAASSVLAAVVPAAVAQGGSATARTLRMRNLVVSNTTATGFGIGWGIATGAGATPGGAATVVRRSTNTNLDPTTTTQGVYSTYATQPTFTGLNGRLWVPGNSTVIWQWNDGEELLVPPAATALPFCVWNTGAGQIADVTLTWEE